MKIFVKLMIIFPTQLRSILTTNLWKKYENDVWKFDRRYFVVIAQSKFGLKSSETLVTYSNDNGNDTSLRRKHSKSITKLKASYDRSVQPMKNNFNLVTISRAIGTEHSLMSHIWRCFLWLNTNKDVRGQCSIFYAHSYLKKDIIQSSVSLD